MRPMRSNRSGGKQTEVLTIAAAALRHGIHGLQRALDELDTPIYTTDGDGRVTFANRACARFQGAGDRRHVSWQLVSDAVEPMPRQRTALASVFRRNEVRSLAALAGRADGTTATFRPYATPLLDSEGQMVGAVNILIDITDRRQIDHLHDQAARCRRLAPAVSDPQTAETLAAMAAEYDEKAEALKRIN